MLDFFAYCNKNNFQCDTLHAQKMYMMYQGQEVEVATEGKLTMEDFMKAKKALIAADVPTSTNTVFFGSSTNGFGFPVPCTMDCNKQEEITPMNTNSERDYLNRRLRDVSQELRETLRKQFNIDQYLGPKTYKELIAWVTGGQYTLNAKQTAKVDMYVADGESWFIDPMQGIVWTGRGVEDRPNFDLACKASKVAKQTAEDIINTGDAAAGLAALNTFASFTYTAPVTTPVAA